MVGVPKCLKALLSDLRMRRRVHQQHAQEHDMPRYSSGFGVVDLDGCLRPDLIPLHVEEVDIMRARMDNRPKQNAVRHLPMKVLALIQWQPAYFGSHPSKDIATHGKKNKRDIDGETESSAATDPNTEG